jgi:hypothetical protein
MSRRLKERNSFARFFTLQRPDYDLVTIILYEKDLSILTPNQVLNKVIAYEHHNNIKPREPLSAGEYREQGFMGTPV